MEFVKTYEIQGFNTDLLKKGQLIKIKRHLSDRQKERDSFRGLNLENLYFIKDITIKEMSLIDNNGDSQTLRVKELEKPNRNWIDGSYYEIVAVYDVDESKFDSEVKFL